MPWLFDGGMPCFVQNKIMLKPLQFEGEMLCSCLAECEAIKSALETAGYTITVEEIPAEEIPPEEVDPDDPPRPVWRLTLARDIEPRTHKAG
jgi:hypothetical protein